MKVILDRDEFQRVLARMQGVVEKRSTYPILSHILLTTKENEISIEATDLQLGIRETMKAQIGEGGRMCLPARKLYDIVRELPPEQVQIESGDNFWARLRCGSVSLELPGVDPSDFPALPEGGKAAISLPNTQLKDMLEKVIFATSSQESPLNLHGVLFEFLDKGGLRYLRMVATDGHRLALIDSEVKGTGSNEQLILPKRGLGEVRRVLTEDGEVEIYLGENVVKFVDGKRLVSIRLLEGQFPDYKHVLPKDLENRVIVDRREFLASLKRADILASEKGEGVKFKIESDKMELKAGGADVGQIVEEVAVQYRGDAISIIFNSRYLIDALTVMESDQVIFELRDEESAGLLRPEGDKDYLYLVMPMKMT